MTGFTAWVPGHGLVAWPIDRLSAHVKALAMQYQPRWHYRGKRCRTCGAGWPCGSYTWAEREIDRYGSGTAR